MSYNLDGASALTAVFATATAGAALTGLSGAATTYSSSAFGFANLGDHYAKGSVSGGTTPTTDGNTGAAMTLVANQAAAFVWAVDTSGNVKVYKGQTVAWTDTTAGSTVCPLPNIPANVTPFAAHTVQAGSTTSGTWTFGTSNWNATGIGSITVRNLCQLRNQPLLTV
jgi:hypothetical protein